MAILKKVLCTAFVTAIAIGFADSALATSGDLSGIPGGLLTNNAGYSGWRDQFSIPGTVGTCPTDGHGNTYATMDLPGTTSSEDTTANRIWALVLAAEMANRSITVMLNDSDKDANGRCIVGWVST